MKYGLLYVLEKLMWLDYLIWGLAPLIPMKTPWSLFHAYFWGGNHVFTLSQYFNFISAEVSYSYSFFSGSVSHILGLAGARVFAHGTTAAHDAQWVTRLQYRSCDSDFNDSHLEFTSLPVFSSKEKNIKEIWRRILPRECKKWTVTAEQNRTGRLDGRRGSDRTCDVVLFEGVAVDLVLIGAVLLQPLAHVLLGPQRHGLGQLHVSWLRRTGESTVQKHVMISYT